MERCKEAALWQADTNGFRLCAKHFLTRKNFDLRVVWNYMPDYSDGSGINNQPCDLPLDKKLGNSKEG